MINVFNDICEGHFMLCLTYPPSYEPAGVLLFISLPPPAVADTWKGRKLAETRYFKKTG